MHPLDEALKLSQRGKLRKAEHILRSLPYNDLRVQYNLGYYDVRNGDLLKGFTGMNTGRWLNVFGSPVISNKPIFQNHDVTNKVILFHSEGGLGDHIINIRFAKAFADMGARVIVSTDISLFPVFRQLSWIHELVTTEAANTVEHDYWVPGMAAPLVLGLTDIDASPYIPRLQHTRTDKLKVGIRWSGNPKFEHEQNRRFNHQPFIDLHKLENVDVYSFQRDDNLQVLPESITDLNHELYDWSHTQRWLSEMDVLVTSCTSVAHMSAAMGIDTRVVVPCLPYYVWANKNIPWYENVTIYTQTRFNSWEDQLSHVTHDITELQQCMHK